MFVIDEAAAQFFDRFIEFESYHESASAYFLDLREFLQFFQQVVTYLGCILYQIFLKINVPENFNFGYDVVDAWAAEQPDKNALLWTNDKGESRQFSFADMKRYTDMTASYFQSLGTRAGRP